MLDYMQCKCFILPTLQIFFASEGLAVGVGFGAIGKASTATFAKAR